MAEHADICAAVLQDARSFDRLTYPKQTNEETNQTDIV